MSWIAKNSITGTTYGGKFESIYDCQSFINTKLVVLEYQFKLAFGLEKYVIDNLKERSIFEIMQDSFKEFEAESGIKDTTTIVIEKSLTIKDKKRCQKEIDDELLRLSNARWQKNNIIRCWYVEQNRFADGFDF